MLERIELDPVELEPVALDVVDLDSDESSILDDIEYPGDTEGDGAAIVDAVSAAFRAREAMERARFAKTTDSEYWVCLCFQTREQVEAFLKSTGWAESDVKYVDGVKVARRLGVKLPADDVVYCIQRIDRRLAAMAMEV